MLVLKRCLFLVPVTCLSSACSCLWYRLEFQDAAWQAAALFGSIYSTLTLMLTQTLTQTQTSVPTLQQVALLLPGGSSMCEPRAGSAGGPLCRWTTGSSSCYLRSSRGRECVVVSGTPLLAR